MTCYRISGVGPEGHATSACATPVQALKRAAGWTDRGFEFVKISDTRGRLHAPADFARLFGIDHVRTLEIGEPAKLGTQVDMPAPTAGSFRYRAK
jgi:hypothetical protein